MKKKIARLKKDLNIIEDPSKFMVTDSKGQIAEITNIYGKYDDDIRIDVIYPGQSIEVPDEEIDYIMEKYCDKIYDHWIQNKVAYYEMLGEGDR
jgi:hypothetical protein